MFRLILVELKRLFTNKLFLALILISVLGLNYTNRPNQYNDPNREMMLEFLPEYLETDTITYLDTKYDAEMEAVTTEINAIYADVCPDVLNEPYQDSRMWRCMEESGRYLQEEEQYRDLFSKYNFLNNLRHQVVFLDEEGLMQYGCDQTGNGEYCPEFIRNGLAEGKKYVLQSYNQMTPEQGQYLIEQYGEDHWMVKGFNKALAVNNQERNTYIIEAWSIGYPSWYNPTPLFSVMFIVLIAAVVLFTNDTVYKFDELSFTTKRGRKVSLAKLIVLLVLSVALTFLLPIMIHYRQLVSGGFNILKDFTANEVQLNYSSSMYWTDLTVGQVEYYKMGYMLLITTTFALFIGTIARVTRGYISMLVASGVVIGMPVILEIVNSLAWRFNFTAFPVQLISYFSPIGNINAFDRFLTHSNGVYLQNIEFISSGIWITIALVLTISLYTFHLTKEDIKT